MGARLIADVDVAGHAGDLIDAFLARERLDRRARDLAVGELGDTEVCVGVRGRLCEMRNAQNLSMRAERTQLPSDDLRHGAADPRVDLVEYAAKRVGIGRRGDLYGEADARQLPARGHLGEAFERLTRIGTHQKLDAVPAMRAEFFLGRLDAHRE